MLTDVPVVYPYSESGVGMVFPVKTGESCFVIISETELDEWRSGGVSQAPLRFDLTSAVMIPGLRRTGTQTIKRASAENAVIISAPDVEITFANGTAVISGNVTVRGNLHVTGHLTTRQD